MRKLPINQAISTRLANAKYKLGTICLTKGDLIQARKCFESALALKPDHFACHLDLSRLKKYCLGDIHLEILESLEGSIASYPTEHQIKYWFALGKARQDTQSYKAAFQAFEQGNRLKRNSFDFSIETRQETVASITQRFDSTFTSPKSNLCSSETPVFIVGMPRSGSTLIEQILDSHSKIHAIGESLKLQQLMVEVEPTSNDDFIKWIAEAPCDQIKEVAQKYIDYLNVRSSHAERVINKLPGNFFYVGLIQRLFPNAKVIYSNRYYKDICISNYNQLYFGTTPFAYDLYEIGQYCRLCEDLMQFWRDVLPTSFIYELKYEEMVENFELNARRLIEFVGLNWEPSCLEFYSNSRAINTASQGQVNQPIYSSSVNRWQDYAEFMQPALNGYQANQN